jgi:hypothetical protein
MKKILITGDSLSYGHGCSDRFHYYDTKLKKHVGDRSVLSGPPSDYCWGSLLGRDLNVSVTNVSRPGSSNHGSYLRAIDSITPDYDLVIFVGTWNGRAEISHYNHKTTRSVIADNLYFFNEPESYKQAVKFYFKYLYHEKINLNVNFQSIVSLYAYCMKHDINFMWTYPEDEEVEEKLYSLIQDNRLDTIQRILFDQCFNKIIENHESIKNPDGHFNDLGHKIFYETYLKERIIKLLNL